MQKKEEFPTFLNEQPTIIFGRTGRELMIMACGLAAAYTVWEDLHSYFTGPALNILLVVLAGLPMILSAFIALIYVAKRPLEEWFFVWLLYVIMPKVYLHMPPQEDDDDVVEGKLEKVLQGEIEALHEDSEED